MKKISITICLLMTMFLLEAQTIHWITFIDTNDKNVGQIDVLGRQVLYSHFINEVNAALAPKGYKSEIHDFYGDKVTPENCKATVELLRVSSPDDIIVFYYIGHGGRPVSEDPNRMRQHPYPQMCMQLIFPESKYIPLEWVDKVLKAKGARLSVTIGMCCNSLSNIIIKDGPTFTPNYGNSYMSGGKMKKIQELFLNSKGNVLATSASPKQTSGCFRSSFGIIDRYTTVLCDIFDNALDDYAKTLTWDDLLDAVSDIIDEKTNGEQTPFHESHLSSARVPTTTTPRVPSQQQVKDVQRQQTPGATKRQGDGDDWINNLTDKLGTLINVNIGEYKRLEMEKKLNDLFASGAQVRIISQDGETVVDREDADVFLGRLATSRLLLKVAVTEGSFDSNGKIQSLKVKEIYKKQ